jgi:peptidoglycan/LPS O-acetylase OafA/YrhL
MFDKIKKISKKLLGWSQAKIAKTSLTPISIDHLKYRPDIDGLRAVAILAVIAFHAFPQIVKGGFIGVDVFFVISGYLISNIIFDSLDKDSFSFSTFYARRITRIFPALILILIFCLIMGFYILLADEFNQLGKHVSSGAGFIANLVLWSESSYFDNSAETKPLLHLWSLGIEEQFYIIWPVILWFSWKRRLNILVIILLLIIISFLLNVEWISTNSVATFYSPQTRAWELLSGSLLAWLTLYKKNFVHESLIKFDSGYIVQHLRFIWLTYRDEIKNVLSIIGIFNLAVGLWLIDAETAFPGKWALLPVSGAILIIFAGTGAWVNKNILSNRVIVWFGLISFPLYLWHWPILSFCRIINGEALPPIYVLAAILISIILAWATTDLIEKPFRHGYSNYNLTKVVTLCILMIFIGAAGYVISFSNFSQSNTYARLSIKRKGFEHAYGYSLAWLKGKNDWLFLGNAYDNNIAKLKLAIQPANWEVDYTSQLFSNLTQAAEHTNTKVVLIIGPDKSTIYPEYLPDDIWPSRKRYISFFLDRLSSIPNLTIYDPSDDLLQQKKSEGLLYWMTDTHWNSKGSYFAYKGLSKKINLPILDVDFRQGSTHKGDIISISKLKDFPLHFQDNWDIVWKDRPLLNETIIEGEQKNDAFGPSKIVRNENPLLNKYIWVVGDSFNEGLEPYFNATFREVYYVGHWFYKLKDLPTILAEADRKPDIIIIVRVERSF